MASIVFPQFDTDNQARFVMLLRMLIKNSKLGSKLPDSYSPELRAALLTLLESGSVVVVDEEAGPTIDVMAQIEGMIHQINDLRRQVGKMDPNDQASMMKNQMGLFEKWVSLREKVLNLREMSEFQQIVIGFMDEVLTPTQRTDFMNRLRPLVSLAGSGSGSGSEGGL